MQATLSGTTLRATLSRIFHSTGAFFAVVLMLAMAPALFGQAVTATLTGTVTDPKGAVLPNATVTIVDENTGSPRATETTKDGTFSVPNLIPSTYTVKVVAQGFSPKEITGIELHTGDAIRLPVFTLAIGATTDTVTVTSVAGQILETENGQRTATLDYKDIQDIALQGRDTTELLKVLPGVVQQSGNGYNALSVTTGTSAIGNGMGVNGAPYKGGVSLNMDGANVLDVGDDFASLATVNPEMTQEVQVQTTNFGADEANGPVVVNTTGRSGGEHYHGEAYFDVRNDVLNANDWSDNHKGQAKNGAHYYYPGGNFSGPIPHTNKKLFFFGGMEYLNQFQGNANQLNFTEMTPAMMKGDFSMDDPDNVILCPGGFYGSGTTVNTTNNVGIDGNGHGVNGGAGSSKYAESSWCQNITTDLGNTNYTIFPDGSTVAGGGTPVVTNYAGNSTPVTNSFGGKMPGQWVDKNMQAYAQNWPAWNSPFVLKSLPAIIGNGGNNVHMPIANSDNGWVARGRLDYNWNSTNQFYISYQQSYDSQLSGGCGTGLYSGCFGSNIQFPGGGTTTRTYSKVLNGHYVHIFSPTLTNEALASWVWGNIPHVPNNPTADYRSKLGASFGCFYCAVGQRFMPTYGGGQGYPGIGVGDVFEPGDYYIVQKAIPTFADNLTKVWGRHTLKFGATTSNTDNYQGSQNGAGEQGSFSFGGSAFGNNPNSNFFAAQGVCTVCNGYTGHVGSGNSTVNFLMGDLTNYQETNTEPLTDLAFQSIGIYGMDTVKVSKKFSLNVGLRFEHIGAWYDRQGIGLAVFYPSRVLPDFYAGKYAPGYYWHAIDAGVPLSGRPDRFGFISPRFGLSYDVFGNGRTTVRGGWGAYRYQEATNAPQNALSTAQGAITFQGSSVLSTLQNSTMLVSQIGQLKPFAPNCQVQCPTVSGMTGFDPHDYGIPLTYSYNFTIDQKLPWNMMFDVGYVGNHAKRLQDTFAGNGDGSGIGNYDNQNKTPLGAYGQTVGIGTGSQYVPNPLGDPITHRLVCNPENLNAPCKQAGTASTDQDFRPYGRVATCTNTANPTCQVYGTQSMTMIQHNAYQNYNALQATLLKRAGPITLNLNATWSKSLGIESNLDPFHISSNNSYDNLQRPWVFNTNYIYREPNFWHGNRFVGGAVNGWTISGITLWQEGTNTDPGININYDPTTLPSVTNQTVTLAGQTYSASDLGLTSTSTGVGASTFFGTNAGISTGRPNVTCNPKSGLATYQLYRPCFTASPFGQSGGLHLPYVAGQAYFENDLAIYKTFTVHEQNKVQFRLTATNWLNHPTPAFTNGESTTEYYLYDYNTHALKPNDRCSGTATGSCNPGLPYLATTNFAAPGEKSSDLFGQQHFKNGFGPYNQRILELNVKYTF